MPSLASWTTVGYLVAVDSLEGQEPAREPLVWLCSDQYSNNWHGAGGFWEPSGTWKATDRTWDARYPLSSTVTALPDRAEEF